MNVQPTKCPKCGRTEASIICSLCKTDKRPVRDPDELVGIAACIVGCVYLALTAGGFA